jgi:hypothetical protein
VTIDPLVRALTEERTVDEWVARARYSRAVWVTRGVGPEAAATGERKATALAASVHRDTSVGRGSATFTLGVTDSIDDALRAALMRADSAVGPAWRTPSGPGDVERVEQADRSGCARAGGGVGQREAKNKSN